MVHAAAIVSALSVGTGHADLYAVSWSYVEPIWERTFYRMSTGDASVEFLSVEMHDFGVQEIALGDDGRLYASAYLVIEAVDPHAGTSEVVHWVPGNCFAYGALFDADGFLFYGIDLWCPDALAGVFVANGMIARWLYLPEPFIAHVGARRDDGIYLAMGSFVDTNAVYSVDPQSGDVDLAGAFEEGTVVESLARDPATGITYMLGQAPGDEWSLYEIDLFTLELSRIGPVNRDIVAIAGMPVCAADFDADGELNVLDFVAFQLAWQAGDPSADVNGDGVLDMLDFIAFRERFEAGC